MMYNILIAIMAAGGVMQLAAEEIVQDTVVSQETVSFESVVSAKEQPEAVFEPPESAVILEKEHYVNANGVNTFILKGNRRSDPAVQALCAEEVEQLRARRAEERTYELERQRLANERAKIEQEERIRATPPVAAQSPYYPYPPAVINNYYSQPYYPVWWSVWPSPPFWSSWRSVPSTEGSTSVSSSSLTRVGSHGGSWSGVNHGGSYGVPDSEKQ